jgi:hypothetical protein
MLDYLDHFQLKALAIMQTVWWLVKRSKERGEVLCEWQRRNRNREGKIMFNLSNFTI